MDQPPFAQAEAAAGRHIPGLGDHRRAEPGDLLWFLVMSDAERLAETRKVLDDLDRLNSQVSYIDVQAKAIKYNSEMLNTYF